MASLVDLAMSPASEVARQWLTKTSKGEISPLGLPQDIAVIVFENAMALEGGGIDPSRFTQFVALANPNRLEIQFERFVSEPFVTGMGSEKFNIPEIVLRNGLINQALINSFAKHLEKFHIPIYESTSRSRFILRAGLSLYSLLGGLSQSTRFNALPKDQWQSLDGLAQDGLKAVYQYYDGRTDDRAREGDRDPFHYQRRAKSVHQ